MYRAGEPHLPGAVTTRVVQLRTRIITSLLVTGTLRPDEEVGGVSS